MRKGAFSQAVSRQPPTRLDLSEMQEDLARAAEVITWNKRILSLVGLWPHERNDLRFSLNLGYMIILAYLVYTDLFEFISDLEHVVMNLTENITYTIVILKLIMLRVNSRQLGNVISAINDDFEEDNYETPDEKMAYMRYNAKAKVFVKIAMPFLITTTTSYYLKPLTGQLGASTNTSFKFVMPYQIHLFYEVTGVHTYLLTYACQLPFVFIGAIAYGASDCLIVTLMFHVCGQMSVLSLRISNMKTDPHNCHQGIRSLVARHVRLIWMAKSLEEAFGTLLLGQFLGGSFLFCILGYNLSANAAEGQKSDLVTFAIYGCCAVLLLYGNCVVGEYLIDESRKVHDAFWDCGWHEMPVRDARSIIICLARSQTPLHLSAGKFYTFSLNSFAGVMEKSMAYLSVLRTLI